MVRGNLLSLLVAAGLCAGAQLAVVAQTAGAQSAVPPIIGLRPDGSRQVGSTGGPTTANSAWFNPFLGEEAPPAPCAPTAGAPRPEATDPVLLSAFKQWNSGTSSWDANLNWSGGASPYTLLTSPYADFHTQVTTLEKGVSSTGRVCTTDSSKGLECYDVTDGSVASVAVQNLGYDPRPIATQPTIAGSTFWWNSEVVASAAYLDLIGSANLAHFYDRPAKGFSPTQDPAHAGFASDVHFIIPADTRSTYLRVEAGARPSPASTFMPFVAPGITIGSINCIVWAKQDGFIYVADDAGGLVKKIDIFEITPATTPNPPVDVITGVTSPLISRVSDGGMFVYVSSIYGHPEIRSYTTGGVDAHYANTTSGSFTRNINPVGIALAQDGSACFIADWATGRVVKIPYNNASAIVDNWGYYSWSFPYPCGIDVDNAGYVTVGNNSGYIARINPSGTGWVNNGYTGGTIPLAIEADRDMGGASGSPIVYGGLPFCEAFNQRPIQAVTGETGGPYAAHYVGAQVWDYGDGQHLQLTPDWTYWLYPHYPQRVVINNNGKTSAEVAYPAPNQSQDRIIKCTASGWPSSRLHLKLLDPIDLAPYAPQDGWCGTAGFPPPPATSCTANPPYEGNDNLTDAGDTYGLTTSSSGSGAAVEINLDFGSGDWTKDFYLKIPGRYSGNNFRIEASKWNPITGLVPNKIVSLSSAYTSWKRGLVERDKMFRRGNLLDPDASGGQFSPDSNSDPDVIFLFRWDQTTPKTDASSYVQPGDSIVIFDTDHQYPTGGYESAVVTATDFVDAPTNPANCFPPDCGFGGCICVSVLAATLDRDLKNAYLASPITFDSGKSAGIGVLSGCDSSPNQLNNTDSCFFDADMTQFEQTYNDAYLEFVAPTDGMGALPFLSSYYLGFHDTPPGCPSDPVRLNNLLQFSTRWFAHSTQKSNYFQLVGVACPPFNLCNFLQYEYIGLTFQTTAPSDPPTSTLQPHITLISPCAVADDKANVQDASCHEPGHQLTVNQCITDDSGHDENNAWCGNCSASQTEKCLMNESRDRTNGVIRFGLEELLTPRSQCSSNRDTAIRMHADPF